jgi:HK97 family phage prohead protease
LWLGRVRDVIERSAEKMEKQYLDIPFDVKAEDITEEGTFKGYGSTFGGSPDAYGDIVVQGAFLSSISRGGRNKSGVPMLWQHQSSQVPGVWTSLAEDKRGLKVEGKLALKTQLGSESYELMKLGGIKGLSIGYDVVTFETDAHRKVRYLKEVDLWEISLVTFPANTRARITSVKAIEEAKTERQMEQALREAGLSKAAAQYVVSLCRPSLRDSEEEDVEGEVEGSLGINAILESLKAVNLEIIKGVIPFKDTGRAPENSPWDAGAEVKQADVEGLRIMCAWYNSAAPDAKGSYKLPHHRAAGGHACVWRAVAAAMAALLGARGGVAIPAADKRGVYNHLAKHYKQFDKEPPEFRDYDYRELKEIFPTAAMEDILSSLVSTNMHLSPYR